MMKKTILALTASLALAGFAQAQEVTAETEITLQIEQQCEVRPNFTDQIGVVFDNTWSLSQGDGGFSIHCTANTPYTVYNTSAVDGRVVLTDSDSGNTMLVGVYSYDDWDLEDLITDTVGIEGVATGSIDRHNYAVVFNDGSDVRPAVGQYQGVLTWNLVF